MALIFKYLKDFRGFAKESLLFSRRRFYNLTNGGVV
jgi:hypothetical protein